MLEPAVRSPERLVRELGAWILVGPPPTEETDEWSFRTLSTRTLRDETGQVEAVLDGTFLVYLLKKARPDGPFRSTILIGRSRTNDVCIAHSSVSKLHARVRIDERGQHFVSDAGSSNGSTLDGVALARNLERPLASGAQLRVGACSVQAFTPERFVSVLTRFAAP
jgi:pSer/pThr/pTyr-binding forkhead associated (FHA) protein